MEITSMFKKIKQKLVFEKGANKDEYKYEKAWTSSEAYPKN